MEITEILSHTFLAKISWKQRFFERGASEAAKGCLASVAAKLVKTLVSRNFCQKSVRENFRNFHSVYNQHFFRILAIDIKFQYTLWKLRKFSLTRLWQKFRESNGFTKEVTKELISRNIFQWERISRFSTLWHCTTN